MSDIQHIGGRTPDLTEENVDKLVALFPDVLTEVTDQQTGKAESGDYDDDGGQLVVNPESNGRFHSDWCSMIYPRLLLARDLLASDGVIFRPFAVWCGWVCQVVTVLRSSLPQVR